MARLKIYDQSTSSWKYVTEGHDHNSIYAGIIHNHDLVYAALGHNHSGVYEPVLSNPDTDGKVLASTSAGVRSWITPSAGSGDMAKSTYDTNNDGKVNSADTADAVPWSGVSSKPSTFAPSTHASSHATGQADAIAPGDIGAATSGHNHSGTYEPVLGNPDVDGKVLSSTAAGARSWITASSGGSSADNICRCLLFGGF